MAAFYSPLGRKKHSAHRVAIRIATTAVQVLFNRALGIGYQQADR